MKRKLLKFVSIVLTVAILSQAMCLDIFAADGGYICDMRISWSSDSADKAKQWLWDNGYDVIDCDLNGDTGGRPWVYLGYKTTDDKEEAITDVKIMNMNGGFVTFDTQEQLREMYSDLFSDGEQLMIILEEFRKNYSEGSVYASTAVDMLNMFYLDDGDLGDFLIEDADVEDLIELRYFAATMPSQVLVLMLGMGLRGNDDKFWVDKLSETLAAPPMELTVEGMDENAIEIGDGEQDLDNPENPENLDNPEETLDENPEENPEETTEETTAETAEETTEETAEETAEETTQEIDLALSYDRPSASVGVNATSLRDYDMSFEVYDAVLRFQEIEEAYDDIPDSDENKQMYKDILNSVGERVLYDDITLLDYLMSIESATDAVPLAASLTDGQIAMFSQQGIAYFSPNSVSEGELSEMLEAVYEGGEKAYYWEGRDEIDYEKGFAMTMDSVANMDLSENGGDIKISSVVFATVFGLIAVAALAAMIYYIVQIVTVVKAGALSGGVASLIATAIEQAVAGATLSTLLTGGVSIKTVLMFRSGDFLIGLIGGAAVFIVFAIMTIFLIYTTVKDFYNPELSAVPWTIADLFTSREGVSNLVYYKAVLDDEGKAGDLNAWEGNSWNSLYTTKDTRVGEPIKANMLAQTGNPDAPYGYLPVCSFGKTVAMNTNIGTYSNTKHFLFFKNNDPHFTGSVFGGANGNLIFGGTGLIVGAAAGVIGMNFATKRKKRVRA